MKDLDNDHGSAAVVIPEYVYNEELNSYEEDMTKKPDKALYLKVGHNDEEVIKKMKEKTDEEKR